MLMKQVSFLLAFMIGCLMVSARQVQQLQWSDWVHCDDGYASTIPAKSIIVLYHKGLQVAYVYNNCDSIAGFKNEQYCQMEKGLRSVNGFTVGTGCLTATSAPDQGGCKLSCHAEVCTCENK